eukprot:Ihof_evm8s189 gene=Ihof_evmTU8s189
MAVQRLPSPGHIPEERAVKLLYGPKAIQVYPLDTQALLPGVLCCNNKAKEEGGPEMLAFIAKMESFDWECLPINRAPVLTSEELRARSLAVREKREKLRQQQEAKDQSVVSDSTSSAIGPVGTPLGEDGNAISTNNSTDEDSGTPQEDESVVELSLEQKEALSLIGFARIYSGVIRVGQQVHVLGPKYTPYDRTSLHHTSVTITQLYIVMGKDLEPVDHAGAGNIVGIGGLAGHVLKCATLCSSDASTALTSFHLEANPIVRVALEPERVQDLPKLVTGLRMLNQSDSLVQVTHTEKGEHIIHTAGEVHLERCIKDLEERYAKIKCKRSAPIVPFRETVVHQPKTDMVNESIANRSTVTKGINSYSSKDGNDETVKIEKWVEVVPQSKFVKIRLRAVPLPKAVVKVLDDFSELLHTMFEKHFFLETTTSKTTTSKQVESEQTRSLEILFREKLIEAFKSEDEEEGEDQWPEDAVERIWALGPRRIGTNILLNCIPGFTRPSAIPNPLLTEETKTTSKGESVDLVRRNQRLEDLDNSIVNGFQLATSSGPLCEEPVRGVCFRVEEVVFEEQMAEVPYIPIADTEKKEGSEDSALSSNVSTPTPVRSGNFSGQLVSAFKEGCRKAILRSHPRLAMAMYTCEIQATSEVLGKVYAVIAKRQGVIISEEMKEGTPVFIIKCYLPVITSFGFVDELRKRASGSASPQLVFSHWEIFPMDPFWVPVTEEELMHFGEKADSENLARKYMNDVRRRKGLVVQ